MFIFIVTLSILKQPSPFLQFTTHCVKMYSTDDGTTPRRIAQHRHSSSSFNSSSSDPTSSAKKGVINESERARRTLRNLMTRSSSRWSIAEASPGLAESFSSQTVDGENRRWSELGDFNNSDHGNIAKPNSSGSNSMERGVAATNKLHKAGKTGHRTLLQVWSKRCAYIILIVLTGFVAYYTVTYEYDATNGILKMLPFLHSAASSSSNARHDRDERELLEPNSLELMTTLDARVSALEQQVGLLSGHDQAPGAGNDDEATNYASRQEQQYARVQARKMQRRKERAMHRIALRAAP